MEIAWLGHSSVILRSDDVTLVADPYGDSLGISMAPIEADIVTVSNQHPHHAHIDGVDGGARVLDGPGEYEVANFYVVGMATRRAEYEGDTRINSVFTIRAEGLTLCHLGDLNQRLSPGQVEDLNQTDVLFVPAGGTCTLATDSVAQLVNLIGPRIVIPVHYRTEGVHVEIQPLDGFLSELGVSEVAPQLRLNVTLANLPRELRVVVLQRTI